MATRISRLEFKQHYDGYTRGLFIVLEDKKFPKDQALVNVGEKLSELLMQIPKSQRKEKIIGFLVSIVSPYKGLSLSNIEILFTPYFEINVLGLLLSLCRNRKLCVLWPGKIENGKAYYAEPGLPEYYESDLSQFLETYIVE